MAGNWKSAQGIASLGKRAANQIWGPNSTPSPPLPANTLGLRTAAYTSVYDKNPDEHVRPSAVPDDVIEPHSDKYWAPHPKTGVFGPATEQPPSAGGEASFCSSPADGNQGSVLEEKAWFRPTNLEDLDKSQNA